jgi:hypothetical protein
LQYYCIRRGHHRYDACATFDTPASLVFLWLIRRYLKFYG